MFFSSVPALPMPDLPRLSSPGKSVPYLFFHRNSPFFRIRIPSDLQACLGKTEYRRSLGRCYAAEAKLRALKLAAAAMEVFAFAREAMQVRTQPLIPGLGQGNPNALCGYAARNEEREKTQVSQRYNDNQAGYTSELQGRFLNSLTDEEIRSIAETWLLNALKGSNIFLMQSAPLRAAALSVNRRKATPEEVQEVLELSGAVEKTEISPPVNASCVPGANILDSPDMEEIMAEQAAADAVTAQAIHDIYQKSLVSRHVTRMAFEVDKQLAAHGIQADPTTESTAAVTSGATLSVPYLLACQEFLKARVALSGAMVKSHQGDYAAYDAEVLRLEESSHKRQKKRRISVQAEGRSIEATTTPESAASPALPKLSEALVLFLDERVREGKWDANSRRRAMDKYNIFQAAVDPDDTLPINKIGAEHLRKYKKVLLGLPANRSKKRIYRDMPLPVLLAKAEAGNIPEEDRLEQMTAINHCQMIGAFLKWAASNEYHTNPAITNLLRLEKPDRTEEEERDPYTAEDIRKLFNPGIFLTAGLQQKQKTAVPNSGGKASRFWVPLLGLLTGARLEELAQLHVDDIVLVDRQRNRRRIFTLGQPAPDDLRMVLSEAKERGETLCLSINDGKEYQRLKNKSSRRPVPLSSILIDDLNFLGYVAKIFEAANKAQQKGTAPKDNGRLFPELKKTAGSNKYGHKLSHWYGAYRERAAVVSGTDGEGKKVFHSFRHTLSDWCLQQTTIQGTAVSSYLGHKQESITFDIYAKGTLPHVLHETITAPFTEYARSILDIEGLKQSYWANRG